MRLRKGVALAVALAAAGGLYAFERTGLGLPLEHGVESVLRTWLKVDELVPLGGLKVGYLSVAAMLAAWFCLDLPHASRRVGFMLGLAFLTLTLCPVLGLRGVLFEPFTSLFAILISGLSAMALAGAWGERRRHELRRFFVGRLGEAGFREVLRAGDGRQLTGRRQVSAVTCRMLNHAVLSQEMAAEELEDFSSSFLKVVAEFLVSRGGYLDECDVHRVRVLFGFPNADENHAVTAARAALELRQRAANLVQELEHRWHKRAVIGAAISSGEVTTGLFGFREFEFFSAVGEALDFGEQLCLLNAEYGSAVLVSAETLQAAQEGLEVRPLEMIRRGEGGRMVEIYELLALKHGLTEEAAVARDAFWQGVILLRKGDGEGAGKQFTKATIEGVSDPVLSYFERKVGVGDGAAGQVGEGKVAKGNRDRKGKFG
jgi:class 3 adenylate cyclase